MFKHPSPAYYAIYDAVNITEELKAAFDEKAPADDPKVVVWAATPEELAVKIGADPATFVAAFDAYRTACEAGKDEAMGKGAKHFWVIFPLSNGNKSPNGCYWAMSKS